MIAKFCGNIQNHDAHEFNRGEEWFRCDGVAREAEDVYVEKYEPSEMAEDGTAYSKVTITIEEKDGSVTTIQVPKAAFINYEVKAQEYVSLDYPIEHWKPRVEKCSFSFQPNVFNDNDHIFTVAKVDKDGNPVDPPRF